MTNRLEAIFYYMLKIFFISYPLKKRSKLCEVLEKGFYCLFLCPISVWQIMWYCTVLDRTQDSNRIPVTLVVMLLITLLSNVGFLIYGFKQRLKFQPLYSKMDKMIALVEQLTETKFKPNNYGYFFNFGSGCVCAMTAYFIYDNTQLDFEVLIQTWFGWVLFLVSSSASFYYFFWSMVTSVMNCTLMEIYARQIYQFGFAKHKCTKLFYVTGSFIFENIEILNEIFGLITLVFLTMIFYNITIGIFAYISKMLSLNAFTTSIYFSVAILLTLIETATHVTLSVSIYSSISSATDLPR